MSIGDFMSRHKFLLGAATGFLLAVLLAGHYFDQVRTSPQQKQEKLLQAQSSELLEEERNTVSVFQNAAASVVFITNKALRQDFFSLDVFEIPQGSGSGFLWDEKGHIVTNYHVIADAAAITVTLSDNSSFEAEVVGAEPSKDIAVLRIAAPSNQLKPIPAGSSEGLLVGQKVLAIGNPFGLDQTLTVGVVSALGREIKSATSRTIRDVIQTDAAINPGNSGGPLLDSKGRLIGINTAIISPSGAYSGVGFAVPVNTVKQVVPQLIQHGKVIRPGLGVSVLPDNVAERLGIEGVMIAQVPEGSAAAAADLRGIERNWLGEAVAGDMIIAINGEKVSNSDDLAAVLEKYKIGDTVQVRVVRAGKEKEVRLPLQEIK